MWRSAGSFTFVIDGSHRLSALAAWINDDYGDGIISKQFYDGKIPEEQVEIAEKTRSIVKKRIGSFKDYELAIKFPEKVDEKIALRAKILGALAIQLQWVEGDSSTAEISFFKINQHAAPIDATELRLLKSRKNLMDWLQERLSEVVRDINIGRVLKKTFNWKLKSWLRKLMKFSFLPSLRIL
ncbi:hypothetical protein JCM19047_676 [Bacillus sp. JCM 19047]|nr:hypothetical protein JCM19047_676 [Bacillus sp. JCM 19047]